MTSLGKALEFAADELKSDRAFVLQCVKAHGWALQHASDKLRGDREIVMEAVKKHRGLALEHASEEMRGDREVVLEAVRVHGRVLEFAGPKLRADKAVVLEAVERNGYALEYSLPLCRSAASRRLLVTGYALDYSSDKLRSDREIVALAVKLHGAWALGRADESLRGNAVFVRYTLDREPPCVASMRPLGMSLQVLQLVRAHGAKCLEHAHRSEEEVGLAARRCAAGAGARWASLRERERERRD